jgi:hypothetical protein
MTDPTFNNIPVPMPLSPAAQAVIDAFCPTSHTQKALAAALRAAAADQNKLIDVPFSRIDQWENIKGNTLSYWTAAQWGYQKAMSEFLAIATELESHG